MDEAARLCRRAEDAGLNALPAPFQVMLDGWLLRFAHGHTRRANSVTVLSPAACDELDRRIDACERLYVAHGLPPLFRVLSFQDATLDAALAARGYAAAEGPSLVLWALLQAGAAADPGVDLAEGRPSDAWIAAQTGFTGAPAAGQRAILDRLAVPAVFAGLRADGPAPASLACAAVHDRIAMLQMIVTDPAARGRGLGRRTVAAALGWAHRAGAREACLQVSATNAPAMRLYEALGFRTRLYGYHYRRLTAGHATPR